MPRAPRLTLLVVAITALLALAASGVHAQDSCAPRLPGVEYASTASTIALYGQNLGRSPSTTALTNAGNAWDSECAANANPTFQTNTAGDMTVRVQFHSGTDSANGFACEGECGCTDVRIDGGRVVGGDVHLFSTEGKTGNTCNDTTNLIHELGHILGLDDSNCSTRIMGNRDAHLQDADCTAVDSNFRTDTETSDPDNPKDNGPCAV